MIKLFKEPLLYFLLVGFALFILYYKINPQADDKAIYLNDESLLTFIQYRSKAFEPELARKRWAAMDKLQQKQLLEDFVEEELLYKEAMSLELNRDDYIIKRRLVQKMDFVLQSSSFDQQVVDDVQLQSFMDKNKDDYRVEPYISFTHIYFSNDSDAKEKSVSLLPKLIADKVPFAGASEYGERFLYHLNYVERTYDYVAAHFGPSFTQALFDADESSIGGARWLGPFDSQHGKHLVLISKRKPAYYPSLEEVRGRVIDDYRRLKMQEEKSKALLEVRKRYPLRGDSRYLDLLNGQTEQ